jgi:hypothetical protein
MASNLRRTENLRILKTNELIVTGSATLSDTTVDGDLLVNGGATISSDTYVDGNLYVGGSTTMNTISFRGTTTDNIPPYRHTIIAEHIYDLSGNMEKSELLLFKGNNNDGNFGPDRVRVASTGGFKVDITPSFALWDPVTQPDGPTVAIPNCISVNSAGNVGIRTGNPTSTLDVSGDVNVGRVLILNGGTAAPPPGGSYTVDPENLTQTYIAFRPNGANSDFAFLRQTGDFSDNSYMLSLDFHDNGGDAGFQIRDIQSANGTGPDLITTRFKLERVSGNVSIGTDTPRNKLTVAGGANIMGNVGIGVTFPLYPLDVSGTVSANSLLVQPTASTAIVKMKLPLVTTNSTQQLVSMDTTTKQLFTPPITVDIVVPPVNYIACGDTDLLGTAPTLQWSNDGFNWFNANSGWFTKTAYNAAYGNGLWVAVGKNTTSPTAATSIKFSTDGKNWSNCLSGGFAQGTGYKVAWNGSIWVASGESATLLNTIQWSNDGKHWNDIIFGGFNSDSPSSGGYGIVWTGTTWLATGFDLDPIDTIQHSTDGKTWISSEGLGFSSGGGGITSFGGLHIAVGGSSNFIQYSTNIADWTVVPNAPNVNADVATNTNGSLWIAVGGDGSGTTTKTIYYSVNPTVAWTHIPSGGFNNGTNAGGRAIIWDGTKWIAAGYITGTNTRTTIKTSIDGLMWQDISSGGFSITGQGLAYASSTTLSSTITISGKLSVVGDLSATGTKAFEIPHPILPNTTLYHAALEGPRADLIYRGRTTLSGGQATIQIDTESTAKGGGMTIGTFEALATNPQVFVSNNVGWDRVRGSVTGGILTIESESPTSTDTIDWLVVAERKDASIKASKLTDSDGFLIPEHPL